MLLKLTHLIMASSILHLEAYQYNAKPPLPASLKGLEQHKLVLNILDFLRRNISMNKWRKQTPRASHKFWHRKACASIEYISEQYFLRHFWMVLIYMQKIMSAAMQKGLDNKGERTMYQETNIDLFSSS